MSTGRRDLHRSEVRRRIEEAAYALFMDRGYAQTTTAAVAEHAGVSPRTLFRYFPAKADLLFGDAAAHTRLLVRAVRERPAEEPALVAALAGARVLAAELDTEITRQRTRIVVEEVGVHSRAREVMDGWVDALSHAVRERVEGEAEARVVALTILHLFNQAVQQWAQDGSDAGPLPVLVDRLGAALVPSAYSPG